MAIFILPHPRDLADPDGTVMRALEIEDPFIMGFARLHQLIEAAPRGEELRGYLVGILEARQADACARPVGKALIFRDAVTAISCS
jgi:hypothetical protein